MTWRTELKIGFTLIAIAGAIAAVLLSAPAIYAIVVTVRGYG